MTENSSFSQNFDFSKKEEKNSEFIKKRDQNEDFGLGGSTQAKDWFDQGDKAKERTGDLGAVPSVHQTKNSAFETLKQQEVSSIHPNNLRQLTWSSSQFYQSESIRRVQFICGINKALPGCYPVIISIKRIQIGQYSLSLCIISPIVFTDPSQPLSRCSAQLEAPFTPTWTRINQEAISGSDVILYKDKESTLNAFIAFYAQYVKIRLDFEKQSSRVLSNIPTNPDYRSYYYSYNAYIYEISDCFMVKYVQFRKSDSQNNRKLRNLIAFKKFDLEKNFVRYSSYIGTSVLNFGAFVSFSSSGKYIQIFYNSINHFVVSLKATSGLIQNLPKMVNLSVDAASGGDYNFSLALGHNESSFAKVPNSTFKTVENSSLVVHLNLEGFLGKFARVQVPSLGISDDKIFLKKLIFDKNRTKNGTVAQDRNRSGKLYPLHGPGYFAMVYNPRTTSGSLQYSSYEIVILKCALFSEVAVNIDKSACEVLSRIANYSKERKVLFQGFYIFGKDYYIIHSKDLKNGINRLNHYKLDSSTPLNISNKPILDPPELFSKANQVKILSDAYAFNLVLITQTPYNASSRRSNISVIFKRVNQNLTDFSTYVYNLSLYYSTSFRIQAYQRDSKLFVVYSKMDFRDVPAFSYYQNWEKHNKIKHLQFNFRKNPPLERRDFYTSSSYPGRVLPILSWANQLQNPSIWCFMGTDAYTYSKFVGDLSKAKFRHIDDDGVSASYVLNYSSPLVALQTECLSEVLIVQVLAKNLKNNKKMIINYKKNKTEFRARYHSKIEVPGNTKHIRAYVSPEKDFINTALEFDSGPLDSPQQVVVTRIKDARLIMNTSKIPASISFKLPVEQVDGYHRKEVRYLNISIKRTAKFQIKNLSKPDHNPNKSQLIKLNETIDFDAIIGVKGEVGNIVLNSTTLKPGEDYIFKGRKHVISAFSIKQILGPHLKPENKSNPKSSSQEALAEVGGYRHGGSTPPPPAVQQRSGNSLRGIFSSNNPLGSSEHPKGKNSEDDNKNVKMKQTVDIISNTAMEKIITLGKWLVGKVHYRPVGSYLRLLYKPKIFENRSEAHDMIITGYDLEETSNLQNLYILKDFFMTEDHFPTTGQPGEVYIIIQMENVNSTNQKLFQIFRSGVRGQTPCFDLLAVINITLPDDVKDLRSDEFYVRARSRISFIFIYQFERTFNMSIYKKSDQPESNTSKKYKKRPKNQLFEIFKNDEKLENDWNSGRNDYLDNVDDSLSDSIDGKDGSYSTAAGNGLQPRKQKFNERVHRVVYNQAHKKSEIRHLHDKDPIPDYFFATIVPSLYKNEAESGKEVGLLIGLINYKNPLLKLYYWPQYNISSTKSSQSGHKEEKIRVHELQHFDAFTVFTETLVPVNKVKCVKRRLYNFSLIPELGPSEVKLQCYIGASGSLSYETEYVLKVNSGKKPLQSNTLIGNISIPDGFENDDIEWLPGISIVRMKNINPYIKINNSVYKECPYMLVVYRMADSRHPWAVYSCEDIDIINPNQKPYFSLYRYGNLSYIWINQYLNLQTIMSTPNMKTVLQSGEQGLTKFSMITVRTIKNSTLVLLKDKAFSFNLMNLTIFGLRQNLMFKRLGLLTSRCITPFDISFNSPKSIWFTITFAGFFVAIYFGLCRDILHLPWDPVNIYLFGYKVKPEELRRMTRINVNWLKGMVAEENEGRGLEVPPTPRDFLEEMTMDSGLQSGRMTEVGVRVSSLQALSAHDELEYDFMTEAERFGMLSDVDNSQSDEGDLSDEIEAKGPKSLRSGCEDGEETLKSANPERKATYVFSTQKGEDYESGSSDTGFGDDDGGGEDGSSLSEDSC